MALLVINKNVRGLDHARLPARRGIRSLLLTFRSLRRQRAEEAVGLVHDADYLAGVAGGAELSA